MYCMYKSSLLKKIPINRKSLIPYTPSVANTSFLFMTDMSLLNLCFAEGCSGGGSVNIRSFVIVSKHARMAANLLEGYVVSGPAKLVSVCVGTERFSKKSTESYACIRKHFTCRPRIHSSFLTVLNKRLIKFHGILTFVLVILFMTAPSHDTTLYKYSLIPVHQHC